VRAVAYLRVSTDEQAESGAGLKAQLDACKVAADRLGAELLGPFADEAVSGGTGLDKRPALLEALTVLGNGDVLLVAKRDRLGRDPIAVAMIEAAVQRQGGRVVSAAGEGTDGDDPTNVLMRRIVDAFAEYERLVIKARTRSALAAKRRRGERTGGVRFGHDLADDGRRSKSGRPAGLVTNPAESQALILIHQLKAEGKSLRQIATELDRRGIPTKTGRGRWRFTVVAKLIDRNPAPTPDPEKGP
jgi:DNA invertase Pin-like site-specific DNA recombinase